MSDWWDTDIAKLRRNSVQKARGFGAEAGFNLIGLEQNPYPRKYQPEEHDAWVYMYRKTSLYKKAHRQGKEN